MPAGEFARYIETQVKPRRAEFLEFVARNQRRFASQPPEADLRMAYTSPTAAAAAASEAPVEVPATPPPSKMRR